MGQHEPLPAPTVEGLDLTLSLETSSPVSFERAMQVSVRQARLLTERPWVRSLGRLGIIIHSTAGYVDPGFSGQVTLEISNLLDEAVALYPGMRIAQISFSRMTTAADRPYGSGDLASKYQGQGDTTASRLYLDFVEKKA